MIYIKFDKLPELPQDKKSEMDSTAGRMSRDKGINFEIVETKGKKISIITYQDVSKSSILLSAEELNSKCEFLFESYFPAYEIDSQAITFLARVISKIDAQWIQSRMDERNKTVVNVADDTGIEESRIEAWLDGSKALNETSRAMFYYYLTKK